MKVCEYVPHGAVPDLRGFAPAIVAQNFAKFLEEDAYIITAIENYKVLHEKSEYGDVYRVGYGAIYKKIFTKITKLDPYPLHARAAEIVEKYPVDVFHAHQLEFPVDSFLKRLSIRPKVAVHVHAMRSFDEKRGVADKYIACSNYTADRLINEKGYPSELVGMTYNGADMELFCPPDKEEKSGIKNIFGIPNDCIVVSYIGRRQEAKGYNRFLKAADILSQKYKNVTFVCVGPTPYDAIKDASHEESKKIETKLLLTGRFLSFPALSHKELSKVYKATDIVYFPTSFMGEQHPVVGVEAIASGCVLLATAFAGIVETIEDGKTGFLLSYPPCEDEGVAKLEFIINNLDSMDEICKNAREFAINTFSWNIVSKKLRDIFTSTQVYN